MSQLTDIQNERQQRANEITTRLKANVASVLVEYPVEIAYLYGSVALGHPLPGSDVDIAVVLSELPPPYERLILELDIQAAIEDKCDVAKVDVRAINNAPLTVQGRIIQKGILLYSRDRERRIAFEVLTRRKYFDYQPTAERMQRAFLERIQKKGLLGGQSEDRRFHLEQSSRLSK